MQTKRLMVVEDNPDLLFIYKKYLQHHGFRVLCAQNGEEALKHVLSFKPHLILCDIKMPHLTGFDMIEIMNTHPELQKNTIILIMSAYGDQKMRRRAERLGISHNRYLVKSQIALKQMLQIVNSYFVPPQVQAT